MRYRDDTTSVTTVAEWREMAESMGIAKMGGPAVGAPAMPDSSPRTAPPSHDAAGHAGHVMPPASITWSAELVEQRLRDAGVSARVLPATGRHIFMSIPARTYQLDGGDELQLFVYPDSAARAVDTERLDPRRVAPADMMIKRRAQPSLIVDGNMAAIVITNDDARRQRVHGALSRQPPR